MGKNKKVRGGDPVSERQRTKLSVDQTHLDLSAARTKHKRKKEGGQKQQEFLSASTSQTILKEAQKQQEELEEEYGIANIKKLESEKSADGDADDDFEEVEESIESASDFDCDEAEEAAIAAFLKSTHGEHKTIADAIAAQFKKNTAELESLSDAGDASGTDVRIRDMYKGIGDILSKYTSGKLPKAFKVLPSLSNWQQLLYLTRPDDWTAPATYQATRIFASNFKADMAQRFYNMVLLPRVRTDIAEHKRLNFHMYASLKKALFKPAAWFKGILLPLCESGTCTLREALIVGSILVKHSVPVLHSSAALLKLAEMTYSGSNSIFIRILLDKKYALPYRVVDAVVFHFLRFQTEERHLPVLWHQCLLTFVQRYKEDLSWEQKDALMDLLRKQCHEAITPEIRRELTQSKCRGEGDASEGQQKQH